MKLNLFIITRNAHAPLDICYLSSWLLRMKQFSLFKKLLAAIICGFQTKDRSKSDRSQWYRYFSAREAWTRISQRLRYYYIYEQVSKRSGSHAFCQERLCSRRFAMLACLTACLWEERCVTTQTILGFHMTSQKFKLRNYYFFWVCTFMWHYSALKPSHKQIFGAKGFFVLRH